MKTGELFSLSEQQILDCMTGSLDPDDENNGCKGGNFYYGLKYVQDQGGLEQEEDYPYVEYVEDTCYFNSGEVYANDTGLVLIDSGDEDALKAAVATIVSMFLNLKCR